MKLKIWSIIVFVLLGISITSCTASETKDSQPLDSESQMMAETQFTDSINSREIVSTDAAAVQEMQTETVLDTEAQTEKETVTKSMPKKSVINKIEYFLSVLLEETEYDYTEQDYIDAHPEAFESIVALGEDALPYLTEIAGQIETAIGCDAYTRSAVAWAIAHRIKPELYDRSYPSPDGKYTLTACAAFSSYIDVDYHDKPWLFYTSMCVTDIETGVVLASMEENFYDFSVKWSPDSRYAAAQEMKDDERYPDEMIAFDIANQTVCSMPRLEIQNCIHGEVPDYVNLYCCDLLSYEWETDSILNVQFDIKTGVSFYHQSHMGWYTYNFESGSITALSYDIAIPEPTVNTMTEAEIKAVIDENLDILLTDGDEYYSEKEFIDAHPEAFENIVALGEAALSYLKGIGDQYQWIGGDTSGNNRCFLAKAAEYVIKPDLYDMVVPSPDGKYAVKVIVNSFVGLKDPFSGIYYNLNLIDIETESNIIMIKDTFLFPWFIYSELPIKWSPDSKYVAVEEGYRYYYTVVKILDVQKADYINLPDKEDVELLLGKDLTYYDKDEQRSYSNVHFFISDWKTDAIKIQIILCDSARGVAGDGFYTYDLIKCEISYIEFDVDHIERK